MIFAAVVAVFCGFVFDESPDPRTLTEFQCRQELKRLDAEMEALGEGDDAAWLAACSRRFAVCRRVSKHADMTTPADEWDRRARKLGAAGDKYLFELAWARALATTGRLDHPDLSSATDKFAAAVAERKITEGEAIADLELCRARLAVRRTDAPGALAAYRKSVEAYRRADAAVSRQYLHALIGFARGMVAGDPKAAVDLLEECIEVAETILKEAPEERATLQRFVLEKMAPVCMKVRRFAHAESCVDRLVPLLEKHEPNLKKRQQATAQFLNMRSTNSATTPAPSRVTPNRSPCSRRRRVRSTKSTSP